MRRRLWLQIYAAWIGTLVAFAVTIAVAAHIISDRPGRVPPPVPEVAEVLVAQLPTGDALAPAFVAQAERLGVWASLWSADRKTRLAQAGPPVPEPPADAAEAGWFHSRRGPVLAVPLKDGRWITGVMARRHRPGWFRPLLVFLAALAAALGVGCYFIARRITGRLELLQTQVDALGRGDLSARVDVDGCDEVAGLARHFNDAAERVQTLVEAQRTVLAYASHELRSPLARLRMALELMRESEGANPDLAASAERDIEELDALVGELLLSSRLKAAGADRRDEFDLMAVVLEEAERTGASATGSATDVAGDRRLVGRMVRNLLENAARYGGDGPVDAAISVDAGDHWTLTVSDRGPGIPSEHAEHVFEPFFRLPGHSEGQHGGVGLGLALVRDIAEAHGWTVGYAPREGGGSEFTVESERA